jgi:hypothetical protein
MSGYVSTTGTLALSEREHTWGNEDGVFSVLALGAVDIVFDSAEEARQVGERCLKIADAIDAKRAELNGEMLPEVVAELERLGEAR